LQIPAKSLTPRVDDADLAGEATMAKWLFKEEPDHYSFANLVRDRKTLWNGVANNLALQNLRKVGKGDEIFFYHTGKEKAVVGIMRAAAGPQPDPDEDDPKLVAVEVVAVKALKRPVTLQEIKADETLASWDLVRLGRLSVMPVTDAQWRRVIELSEST
jgi:predicted RNA-binding protein with PUA-like domain